VFYTKAQDGLKQKWYGKTFLNQPYSEAGKWTDPLIESYRSRAVPEAIMLTNAETGANWYQEAMRHCSAYCKIRGRLKFRNKNGTIGTQPRWSSVVFYFGPDPGKFMRCFQDLGTLGMPVTRVPEGEKWQPELTWKGPPLWSVTMKPRRAA
jgi:hypothetical protein